MLSCGSCKDIGDFAINIYGYKYIYIYIYMNALSFIANTQYIGEYDVPFPLVASLITFLHSKLRNYVLPSPAVWLGHVFEKISALSNALKCVVTCSWSDIG